MGLNPREKSERNFDGSKQVIPGNGVKTVQKKANPFEDIIKRINDEPGIVPTPLPTPPPTPTPIPSPSPTVTPTVTPSISLTPSITPSISLTPSITPSNTLTPTMTPTMTPSRTPRSTPSPTTSPKPTPSISPSQTITTTPTVTPTSTPNCFCYGFTNVGSDTQKINVRNCSDNVGILYVPINDAVGRCIRPNAYTGITSDFTVTLIGTCDPSGKCGFSVTPTPTPTMTPTPNNTPSPTKTPTLTPTKTPTLTPTKTPAVTPTPTTTNSPTPVTPTPTPSMTMTLSQTPTVTPTITVSPSRVSLIGPYLKFVPYGSSTTTSLIFRSQTGATFDIRWGNGNVVNAVPNSVLYSNFTYTQTVPGSPTLFGSVDNFRTNGVLSVDKIVELTFNRVREIDHNQYTFSSFTATTSIKLSNSAVYGFNYTLPASLISLTLEGVSGRTTQNLNYPLVFNPTFINRATFRNLTIKSTNMETFNYPITGGSSSQDIQFLTNSSLKSITTSIGSNLVNLTVDSNVMLTALTISNQLTASTILDTLTVTDNPLLKGWNYNLPASLTVLDLGQNDLRTFDIDLTPNTNLAFLECINNSIPSLTNTISACTSLSTLRVDGNLLTSLPPVLPNSIRNLYFRNNYITGYNSNFPTSTRNFDGSSEISAGHTINTWTLEVTGATLLQNFYLNKVKLNSWTKQFPPSIRTVQLRNNNLKFFDVNLISGATELDLSDNTGLVEIQNLNFNNTIQRLYLNNVFITSSTKVTSGSSLPSSLRDIQLQSRYLSAWTTSFSSCTNIQKIFFTNSPLNQTSVDNILYDLRYNSSVNFGQLYMGGSGFTGFSGPASPSPAGLLNKQFLQSSRNWQVVTN